MIRHLRVFLVFLVLNTMIASIYLVWGVIRSSERGQWKNYLFKAEVMLFCPGVGPMFFFISNLIYKVFFRKAVDLADVIFSKERVTTFKRADIEAEGNLVPIEEALVVSDKGSQRALLLKVARGDIQNSLASISLALNSDDSETAHYAAAVLQDALNDFRQRVQELYDHMKENEEDAAEYASLMIQYMNNMLSQSVFDELEQKKYVSMMEEAGEVLYEKDKTKLSPIYIECICLRLLQIEEYDRIEPWCERSKELHPDVLSTYTIQLKFYFTIQNKEKFFQVLNSLKQSDIVIDRDTLALIRAFYETDKKAETQEPSKKEKEEKAVQNAVSEEKKEAVQNAVAKEPPEKNIIEENKDTRNKDVKNKDTTDTKKEIEQHKDTDNTAEKAAAVIAGAAVVNAVSGIAGKDTAAELPKHEVPMETAKESEAAEGTKSTVSKETTKEEIKIAKDAKSVVPKESIKEDKSGKDTAAKENVISESAVSEMETTKNMVSEIIDNLMEESAEQESVAVNAAAKEDMTRQINEIIEDLIEESAEQESAATNAAAKEDMTRQINEIIENLIAESERMENSICESQAAKAAQIHNRQVSDQRKIDVLKTIARKHKVWTCVGLGLVILAACLFIHLKNKKNKEEV